MEAIVLSAVACLVSCVSHAPTPYAPTLLSAARALPLKLKACIHLAAWLEDILYWYSSNPIALKLT